ncbi:hypothetical protein [uncultured Shewanella sp.]|uniref:hypothetical protein n=1 Tax=uncultured Shewanella sp. TaxID=173975 RepID=UPI00260BD0F9|nr:hypothetical protein [uncultured Shewanella sp.]
MSNINTANQYSTSADDNPDEDNYTENSTYRTLLTLNGHTLFYVNTWYKYTPGIVTWVTLGQCNLINIGSFTEIVFPSSIYFNMGPSLSWNGKVYAMTFKYQEAAIKKLSATLLSCNAKAQRKQAVISGIKNYLANVEVLSHKASMLGVTYNHSARRVNVAASKVKALALDVKQEQASIDSGLLAVKNVVNSNCKAMNKVSNIKSFLSNSVCRVNSGNISIKDDIITTHL